MTEMEQQDQSTSSMGLNKIKFRAWIDGTMIYRDSLGLIFKRDYLKNLETILGAIENEL